MAGTAEVSTSNLRSGASFDNLKATWGKKLSLGDFSSQLDCSYDYNANRDFLKSASVPHPLPALIALRPAPAFAQGLEGDCKGLTHTLCRRVAAERQPGRRQRR